MYKTNTFLIYLCTRKKYTKVSEDPTPIYFKYIVWFPA